MKTMEASDLPPIDLPALGKMLGDDAALVQMILEKFRAEVQSDIEALAELAVVIRSPFARWLIVSRAPVATHRLCPCQT